MVNMPTDPTDTALAARLVTAPRVVRPGAGCWDRGRTPIHPLTLESAYADPDLLRDLGARGARSARARGVGVVGGAVRGGRAGGRDGRLAPPPRGLPGGSPAVRVRPQAGISRP